MTDNAGPKYVIAPEGCADYLTKGKRYPVRDWNGDHKTFWSTSDNGTPFYTGLLDSLHLNGGDWIIPDVTEAARVADGGPAFAGGDPVNGGDPGMSLRAYAAVAAMQGMGTWMPVDSEGLAHNNLNHDRALWDRAKWAVRQADALLAALKGTRE
jgi:hypothetical protein